MTHRFALVALLVLAPTLRAQDETLQTKKIDDLVLPSSAIKADEAEERAPTVVETTAKSISGTDLDWGQAYRAPPAGLSEAGRITLAVVTKDSYGHKQCVRDLNNLEGDTARRLVRNLDVGRHDILKQLYAEAFLKTNQDFVARGKSPLEKLLGVNSGGTGDMRRDQDITLFAGSESQEKAFFDQLKQIAESPPYNLKTKPASGGINIPELDVNLFPGKNDLPDARYATDSLDYRVNYAKGIARQAADPEAYPGGASDIEVKGRRRPGKIHIQEYRLGPDGSLNYRGLTPGNAREARRIFSGTPKERYAKWKRASHIFGDFLQARHHLKSGEPDPTKGPLKYAGRAIEQLCEFHGKRPWIDLDLDERLDLLNPLFPQFDADTKHGKDALLGIVKAVSVGDRVYQKREMPAGAEAARSQEVAIIFLRKAVAATAGETARAMLSPPDFNPNWRSEAEIVAWAKLTPEQREKAARDRDETYRECVTQEATENLLITLTMLHEIDIESKGRDGETELMKMIDRADSSDPRVKAILADATEYAKAYTEFLASCRAEPNDRGAQKKRFQMAKTLVKLREKLARHTKRGGPTPGTEILRKSEDVGPRVYTRWWSGDDGNGRHPPGSAPAPAGGPDDPLGPRVGGAMAEVKERFAKHLEEAFPSHRKQYQAFLDEMDARGGGRSYLKQRLFDEVCQLDTLTFALNLIEYYQQGADRWAYCELIGTEALSRLHWGFSPLIQAVKVRDEQSLKELGKGIVFMTLARLVPWAGTAKMVFDFGKGVVNVTVGYAVGVVNADLVDALYLGEAGRKNSAAGGDWGSRNREAFSVLDPSEVIRRTNKDSGELEIVVDTPAAYRHWFDRTVGQRIDELPRRNPPGGEAGRTALAHDAFVNAMIQQAESEGPLWVREDGFPKTVIGPTREEMDKAVTDLRDAIESTCRAQVQKVLSESATRTFKVYGEKNDRIEEALVHRYSADVLSGLLGTWQTQLVYQALAMRSIERTALQADLSEYARLLRPLLYDPRIEPVVGAAPAPVRNPDDPAAAREPLEYELEVQVAGAREEDDDACDGGLPVLVSVVLQIAGELSDAEKDVAIEVLSTRLEPVAEPGEEAPEKLVAGGRATDQLIVRVIADEGRGAVIAEKVVPLTVRLPQDQGGRVVPLLLCEEKYRDGRFKCRYTYFERFPGMPSHWVTEDGEVYHGEYESDLSGGREIIRYEYGIRNGDRRELDAKGRLRHVTPWKDGVTHGTEIYYDPDTKARAELVNVDGRMTEKRCWADNGQLIRSITYNEALTEDDRRCWSGTAEARWPNGTPRWSGTYDKAHIDLNEAGGGDAEQIPGKVGTWTWFHENGELDRRAEFLAGRFHGAYEEHRDDGTLVCRAVFVNGQRTGQWEHYWENGRLQCEGRFLDDREVGRWEYYDSQGNRQNWVEFNDLGEKTGGGSYQDD